MPGYTRRELKQDKFAESAQGAALWATGHRQTVILIAGLVLVVIIAGAGFYTWYSRQTEQGNTELATAMRTFDEPLTPADAPAIAGDTPKYTTTVDRAKAAQKQFSAVADKYSFVAPGKIALYMSGMALEQTGDKAAAEQELKKAANLGDKDVAALAKMALGALYRESNRVPDAIAVFKEVSDHPTATVSKSAAQLELASIYETTDPAQATQIYQSLQKDDPQSPAAQVASQKLSKSK
ncbi:MAG TPA: tetratricopeptide repeat protein [Candidatus Angelobacter sp.]